jgi:ubiquinone/menaquinone biosynthesis C-methylase UbiE
MLSKARAALPFPQAFFLQASLDALPLESTSFDGALAVMVLQHLLEEAQFLKALDELVRVVKPGGRILIIDGIGKTRYQPTNSPVTFVRILPDYDTLKNSCRLLSFSKLVCAGDDYSVLVWERIAQTEADYHWTKTVSSRKVL